MMGASKEHSLRVLFMNIAGFPLDSKELKNKRIFEALQGAKADVSSLMECNVNWKAVDIHD